MAPGCESKVGVRVVEGEAVDGPTFAWPTELKPCCTEAMWSGAGVSGRGVDLPVTTTAYVGRGSPGGLDGGGIRSG